MEQGRQSWRKFYNKVVLQFVPWTKYYRNEYQEYFLGGGGVKLGGSKGWQPYHFHVMNVLKSGSLNLLEPSGPVQACNWIVLLLPSFISILGEITLDTYSDWRMSLKPGAGLYEEKENSDQVLHSFSLYPLY